MICTALALYQDVVIRELVADRDAALKRCDVAHDRLQCQRFAENDYAETYPTQMVRTGAFQIAGVMLIGLGIATWLIRVKRK